MGRITFLGMLIAVLLAIVHQSKAAAVSDTVCVADIDTDCTADHSECDDDAHSPKCKCSDGYKEDTDDMSTCVKIPVSETPCVDNNNADCTDPHSECDNANNPHKCKCSDGYKEDSNDKSICVKIPVSETPCSDNTQCKDTHSECDKTQNPPKCKCSNGYKKDSTDGSTCETIPVAVTDISCGNGDADCKYLHSVCDNAPTTPKCKCSDGYKKNPTDESSCVKIPEAVLDTACPGGNNDCTAANSECDAADTSPKCKCKNGFRQDTKDHTKCKKELGQTCSKGECLFNAECDTTCKCSDEHIEKDGVCVVPSSTIKAGLSKIVMIMWVLCVVIVKLF